MDTTEIEKKSLEAHVELCAERYKMLEHKLSDVEKDICDVKTTAAATHELVTKLSEKNTDRLIAWGVGIIGFLVATLGWMLNHYVFV